MLVSFLGGHASAGVIVNGDFSDPFELADFRHSGTSVSEPTGQYAELRTDGILQQTFDIPNAASTLSFHFAFSGGVGGAVPAFLDSLFVDIETMIDPDFVDILVVDFLGVLPDPSDGFGPLVTLPIDVNFDPGITIAGLQFTADHFGRISLALPNEILGERATITFTLNNTDNFDSIAAIDNITLTSATATVPEPASFAVWSVMAFGLLPRRRRRSVAE